MTWFSDLRRRWGRKQEPPVITTIIDGERLVVTEWARSQAASNMRHDRAKRNAVEQLVIAECQGDKERGRAEMRRRYPESFYDD